jgi:hypothetical protein
MALLPSGGVCGYVHANVAGRGWVVLASDTSHYYEHMETGRVFPTAFHVGEMVEGYDKLRALAERRSTSSRATTRWSWNAIRRRRRTWRASSSGSTCRQPTLLGLDAGELDYLRPLLGRLRDGRREFRG